MARQGILTTRFDEAVAYALAAHDKQKRKGSEVPYAAHLLGVASLILEAGGTETEAIAGLLHDVVEDQGIEHLAEVRERFGDEVAAIVLECSAEDKTDDPGWRAHKKRYLAAIEECSESALMVSLADKVYNARSILEDLRLHGPSTWERFNADEPKDRSILWYYRSLVSAYGERRAAPRRLLGELERTIDELSRLIGPPPCPACCSSDVAEIWWGLPDAKASAEAETRGVILGGCCLPEEAPDFQCRHCENEWPDPQYADQNQRP
jgi:hypothetical protein